MKIVNIFPNEDILENSVVFKLLSDSYNRKQTFYWWVFFFESKSTSSNLLYYITSVTAYVHLKKLCNTLAFRNNIAYCLSALTADLQIKFKIFYLTWKHSSYEIGKLRRYLCIVSKPNFISLIFVLILVWKMSLKLCSFFVILFTRFQIRYKYIQ